MDRLDEQRLVIGNPTGTRRYHVNVTVRGRRGAVAAYRVPKVDAHGALEVVAVGSLAEIEITWDDRWRNQRHWASTLDL